MSQMKEKLKINTELPAIEDLKLLSVKISKKEKNTEPELLGTGTIVCDGVDFYVITAAHCFRDKDGQQNCWKDDIELTLYNDQYKPTNLEIKSLDMSDTKEDTAIISIKTPPGSGYYFNTLKLLGKELDGLGYVFGYTQKRPEGRRFEYKRVNTNIWSNNDGIQEKGEDFFKTIKGSSGGGVFVKIDDRVYCMGFIRSTFDDESSLADVKVQPVNRFKKDWGSAYYPTIKDAIGEHRFENSDNELPQECVKLWRDAYDAIYNNKVLSDSLCHINEIRKQYTIPKTINQQNNVISLLFRKQDSWTEEMRELFLTALEDKGMWPSIYGDNIPAINELIKERDHAKKLERRAITLTKCPCYDGIEIKPSDDQSYYERILRDAYALNFASVKKMVTDWKAKGFWIARKTLFANMFCKNKNEKALEELNEYLKDTEDNIANEKFIATVVYNVVNGDFSDRKSYVQFTQKGLEGITTILAYIADNIDKRHNKVSVYGIHQRFLIGGEDTVSVPEALRLLRSIIDAGILTSFNFTNFVSPENWMKVVKHLFTSMPYPILFYTLMYTDEKLLKRVGQEYAYSEDEDVIKALPDIQLRMLNAIGNDDTPNIYIGLYLISSELYVALNEDIWFDKYRDNVLRNFCKEDSVKNVSHNDPIFINVREGMRFVKDTTRRIEIFQILTSVLTYNSHLINGLIYDYLWVDDTLMSNDEFITLLMNTIKKYPLKDTYMLASKFGKQMVADDKLRNLIDEVVKRDGLFFGTNTTTAICMLSDVVRDDTIKLEMKELLLDRDIWNCGITNEHLTDPHPIELEIVDASIGWTDADWNKIKINMHYNMDLISGERCTNNKEKYQYFGRQYIALLSNMKYFIKNIKKVEGCEVQDVEERIDDLLQELRAFKNVTEELSSDDYDTVVDGIMYLRYRLEEYGFVSCKMEIQLLIHRVLMQVPIALEYCVWLLSYMVEHYPEEITKCFGKSLLEVVKKYAVEFDYETLFVEKTSIYKWMRNIAICVATEFDKEEAVKYWLEDEKVNRFNFM